MAIGNFGDKQEVEKDPAFDAAQCGGKVRYTQSLQLENLEAIFQK